MKSISVKQYLGVEVFVDVTVPDDWSEDDIEGFAREDLSLRVTVDFAEGYAYNIGISDEEEEVPSVYGLTVESVSIDEAHWTHEVAEETK